MSQTIAWTSWGSTQPELPRAAKRMLVDALGLLQPDVPTPIAKASLPTSRLREDVRQRFVGAVGPDRVRDDDETRARHAGGQSYIDLLRRRRGDAAEAPDAVLVPATGTAVGRILEIATDTGTAVVTWGGGTSVVGGLASLRGDCEALVALDLSDLRRLVSVDEVSMTATFEPGIRTPDAEAELAKYGLHMGHVPQSYERASLGGYVVTRSAGQASAGVGRIDDLLVGCRMVTPRGELVLPALPGSAAGPDLRRLVLGSEGTLGVVTEVTVRVRRLPAVTHYEGWMAPSWQAGVGALRRLAQEGPMPDVARLSDPDETAVSMAMSGTGGLKKRALARYLAARRASNGCLVIVGYQGSVDDVRYRRRRVRRELRDQGVVSLGAGAGRSWESHRFAAPYLRDTLLDNGVLAETLETATTWSRLDGLRDGVRRALQTSLTFQGRPPLVGCHVSHLYPTGASLYFTVLARTEAGHEIDQWATAKRAANQAIVDAGGTITHHHAVGTAHRDAVMTDLGGADGLGVEALRAVKRTLDPAGILNPGKLLPAG